MRGIAVFVFCLFAISTLVLASESFADPTKYWPQWRGPEMTGVAPHGDPPVEWGEDKNIRWKIEIPGKGHASPVVWYEKIFVLTAIETDKDVETQEEEKADEQLPAWRRRMSGKKPSNIYKYDIFAINRRDGKILWQRTASEEAPLAGTHTEGSWASNSPITDGERVYA